MLNLRGWRGRLGLTVGRLLWRMVRSHVQSYLLLWLCEARRTSSNTLTMVDPGGGSADASTLQTDHLTTVITHLLTDYVQREVARQLATALHGRLVNAPAGPLRSGESATGGGASPWHPSDVL